MLDFFTCSWFGGPPLKSEHIAEMSICSLQAACSTGDSTKGWKRLFGAALVQALSSSRRDGGSPSGSTHVPDALLQLLKPREDGYNSFFPVAIKAGTLLPHCLRWVWCPEQGVSLCCCHYTMEAQETTPPPCMCPPHATPHPTGHPLLSMTMPVPWFSLPGCALLIQKLPRAHLPILAVPEMLLLPSHHVLKGKRNPSHHICSTPKFVFGQQKWVIKG